MAITLSNITSGFNTALINANFQKVEDYINDILLARADTGVAGEAKMSRDLDMDGHTILNADLDGSSITNDRALRVPASEGPINPLAGVDVRKGKVLGFDPNDGLPTVFIPASGSAADVLMQLTASGGDKLIGSSNSSGSVFDDYAIKAGVFPLTNIYPTMTNAEINAILASGGGVYFNTGDYTVSTVSETIKFGQNTQVFFHPNAKIKAGADGVTVARASALDVSSAFIRNCKIHDIRIDLTGFNNCIGLHLYSARNNTGVFDPWIDMGLGTGNTGIKIEFMSYGVIISNSEVLNGGTGGRRLFVLNGPNAITIKDHRGYSGDPANKCDYGIVVFNSTDGSTNVDYVNTFSTAAVCITGGFSQNTSQFGLYDSADGTNVYGTYFERNDVADINLSSGSRNFYCAGIQHSHSLGDCMYRGRGCVGAVIHSPNNGLRTRWFDFSGASQCYAYIPRARAFPGGTVIPIGNTDGLAVDRGAQSFAQYTSGTLPIDIRQGYALYYINVTSGLNITVSGTPYNGQQISMLVRGSNIASLSFAGVPVDVTGANTSQIKTAQFTATYWSAVNKWTLSMPSWTSSS